MRGTCERVDESTAVGFPAGVESRGVDAVGILKMGDEIGGELEVVDAGDGVGGSLPVGFYSGGVWMDNGAVSRVLKISSGEMGGHSHTTMYCCPLGYL